MPPPPLVATWKYPVVYASNGSCIVVRLRLVFVGEPWLPLTFKFPVTAVMQLAVTDWSAVVKMSTSLAETQLMMPAEEVTDVQVTPETK